MVEIIVIKKLTLFEYQRIEIIRSFISSITKIKIIDVLSFVCKNWSMKKLVKRVRKFFKFNSFI